MSLQSISVALDTYLPTSSPCAVPLTRPPEFSYTRPILPLAIIPGLSFHRYRETGEIFRLPKRDGRRDSTGDTLICPPRIKATACEILSLALETRLFELAKLDATRETLISQLGGYRARKKKPSALRPWADTKREMCLQKNLLASEDASTRRNTRKLKARGHHIAKDVYPFVQLSFPSVNAWIPALYFPSLNLNFFNLSLGISGIYNLITCYNYVGTSMT